MQPPIIVRVNFTTVRYFLLKVVCDHPRVAALLVCIVIVLFDLLAHNTTPTGSWPIGSFAYLARFSIFLTTFLHAPSPITSAPLWQCTRVPAASSMTYSGCTHWRLKMIQARGMDWNCSPSPYTQIHTLFFAQNWDKGLFLMPAPVATLNLGDFDRKRLAGHGRLLARRRRQWQRVEGGQLLWAASTRTPC